MVWGHSCILSLTLSASCILSGWKWESKNDWVAEVKGGRVADCRSRGL